MYEVSMAIPDVENDVVSFACMICHDATKEEIELFNKLTLIAKIRSYTKDALPFEKATIEKQTNMVLQQLLKQKI